ncbi:MAG: hypothetical protein V1694_10990 [Candidatus Eisenbacteria bacterium]
MTERFGKIQVLRNEIEAHLMEQALTEQDIPFRLRSYHDSAYDGLYQAQKGWGHIEAPESCKEEILAIYEELVKGTP